jgi:electron transfer flavoprotein beta subunit
LEELGIDVTPRTKTLKVEEPPVRQSGKKVKDVTELINTLRKDGVI